MKNFTITWKLLLIILLLFCWAYTMDAQSITRKGNVFEQTSSRTSNNGTKTEFTYKDSKGNQYPIYITSKGRCYVMKISGKTGKEYKYYLPKETSKEIAKELGITYEESNIVKKVAETVKNVKVKSPSIGGFTVTTTI